VVPTVQADTSVHYPWETGLVLLLWGWCGYRLLRGEERGRDPSAVRRDPDLPAHRQ